MLLLSTLAQSLSISLAMINMSTVKRFATPRDAACEGSVRLCSQYRLCDTDRRHTLSHPVPIDVNASQSSPLVANARHDLSLGAFGVSPKMNRSPGCSEHTQSGMACIASLMLKTAIRRRVHHDSPLPVNTSTPSCLFICFHTRGPHCLGP
ncbi:hypothetical protein QBC32DRAFT_140805 [Pseudoneurospora amorphoporcata]|uniref:Secreted protein n=1 Tax=Pseudoneurospora amorphoporcata TaxID=241081 RepID=A0AAN6NZ06_9PEZI|nr:hypothetical protein QBC32DRAFT_140805 [Pseudoneurospora amorphoporcata]